MWPHNILRTAGYNIIQLRHQSILLHEFRCAISDYNSSCTSYSTSHGSVLFKRDDQPDTAVTSLRTHKLWFLHYLATFFQVYKI